MDYKPPDIKKTDIYKMTKTTMQHFNNINHNNKSALNKTENSFNSFQKRQLSLNDAKSNK